MSYKYLIVMAALFFAACGGGSSPPPTEAPTRSASKVQDPATALQVVGNSLAKHSPLPSVGWTGDWGMAASEEAKDYAHLVAASLDLPLSVQNLSAMERGGLYSPPTITATTVLVVQLGDNATDLPGFAARYKALLDGYTPNKLVCVSTWWEHAEKDAMIKAQCQAHGGKYVYIGDIYPVRQDAVGTYANRDVDAHPHDWSMAQIAKRVSAAIKEGASP